MVNIYSLKIIIIGTSTMVMNSTNAYHNLETNCLIWLDNSVNKSEENISIQQIFRGLINQLWTFDNVEQCLQCINSLSDNDRIVMIVNGRLGRVAVPNVSSLRKVISIYVYCMDREMNQQWARQYPKVS